MKTGDLDILILPGLGGGTENHWYHRWNGKLKTARIVEQSDWHKPDKDRWVETIVSAAKSTDRPVFIIAHGLGAIALAMLPINCLRPMWSEHFWWQFRTWHRQNI